MGFIDYEVDGQVGIITINRPKALNALNSEVLKDLEKTNQHLSIYQSDVLSLLVQERNLS